MKIQVMSRDAAVRYCHQQHSSSAAIISISTPYITYHSAPFISDINNVTGILRLQFADADRPGSIDVYGKITNLADMMSDDDARKIAAFVKAHEENDIIVHCDAGISRSSGVAAALLKHRCGDDSAIFKGGYCPNMWCYRKTLEALYALEA